MNNQLQLIKNKKNYVRYKKKKKKKIMKCKNIIKNKN